MPIFLESVKQYGTTNRKKGVTTFLFRHCTTSLKLNSKGHTLVYTKLEHSARSVDQVYREYDMESLYSMLQQIITSSGQNLYRSERPAVQLLRAGWNHSESLLFFEPLNQDPIAFRGFHELDSSTYILGSMAHVFCIPLSRSYV